MISNIEASVPGVYRRRCRLLILILMCFPAFSGCAGGGGSAKQELPAYYPGDTVVPVSGPDAVGVKPFDDRVSALLKKWNIPGAAIAVARNGQLVVARGYGYADYEAKDLMHPEYMFRIGSNSKVLTSMAILHLKDQGLIQLDTKFLDILTQYQVAPGGDPRLRDITIRDLLRHSGGWDRDKTGDPMSWQGTISKALSKPMPVHCPDVIRYMMGQPLDFAPGTKQVYSNFGYCILGRVIEKVSGQPYEIYVRNTVLAPMDVHAMSIGYSHDLGQRGPSEVKYYDYNGAPFVKSVFPDLDKATFSYGGFEILSIDAPGGWIGSPIDLTRVMTAIDGSRTGPFLSAETMMDYIADPGIPDWNSDQNYWYGLGIFVGPTTDTWYHGGSISGTESQLYRDPNGYTWCIMTNSQSTDSAKLHADITSTMQQALGSGVQGSDHDLYPQFLSPPLPPRTK